MKIFTFLFAFYLLAISCAPCVCSEDCKEEANEKSITATPLKHNQEKDNCTPFCSCACCATPAYCFLKLPYTIKEIIVFTNARSFGLLHQHFSSYKCHNIWQPPKLSC